MDERARVRSMTVACALFAIAHAGPALAAGSYAENFDDQQAQGWSTVHSTWTATGGYFKNDDAQLASNIAVYDGDTWASNFTYNVRLFADWGSASAPGNQVGAVFNYEDSENYYELRFNIPGEVRLNKVIGGTPTTVATGTYPSPGNDTFFDVEIVRAGSNTTVRANGAEVFTDIPQTELDTGKIGLACYWNFCRYDDVAVAPLTAAYAENFDDQAAQGWSTVHSTWTATGGYFKNDDAQLASNIAVYDGSTWISDFTYSVRLFMDWGSASAPGNQVGAVFNYEDSENYYEVRFNIPGEVRLNKVIDGTSTTVATGTYPPPGNDTFFDVEITRTGANTSVHANGAQALADVPQTELGAGKIGLACYWNFCRFDDVSVASDDGGGGGGGGGGTPAPGTRDPLQWPFAQDSIWNMPIGSGAIYVPANLSDTPGAGLGDPTWPDWAQMPQIDPERIVLTPSAPLVQIAYSSAAWTGANRCNPTSGGSGTGLPVNVPIPSGYVQPHSNENESAVFLMPDGRTLVHTQPFARCTAGGPGTSVIRMADTDLYGDGRVGSHGGSRLSAIGGSIRVGELRPGAQGPRHALKINVYSKEALYNCSTQSACFRWPAFTADSGAVNKYGTDNNNQNAAMKMGALLAIPPWTNIDAMGLETEPGRQLAWTLQNYGAYIVDSTGGPSFAFNVEDGPHGSKPIEFENDYGFEIEARVRDNTPWSRDVQRLVRSLHVVDNNGPTSIGGGGTPRQPLAPPFQ